MHFGECARRDAAVMTDDPQHEALRAGYAKLGVHALGRRLEPVGDGPEQLHEAERLTQRLHFGGDGCLGLRLTQADRSSQKLRPGARTL
jgi:hypothetical protein